MVAKLNLYIQINAIKFIKDPAGHFLHIANLLFTKLFEPDLVDNSQCFVLKCEPQSIHWEYH